MKILFISALLPYPLYSGGQVRIYNLLKRLSENHEITLVAFIREEAEKKYLPQLNFCKVVHTVYRGRGFSMKYLYRMLTGSYPLLISSYENPALRKLLQDLLLRNKFDLIHTEPFYVFPSIPETDIPRVIAEHNIEFQVYRDFARTYPFVPARIILNWDAGRVRGWEEKAVRTAKSLIAVSDTDADYLKKMAPGVTVTVVPNGVDTDYFRMSQHQPSGETVCMFVGNFSWLPNLQSLKYLIGDVWPVIKNNLQHIRLKIIGRNIPRWAKNSGPSVDLIEDASDIRPFYKSADILLAPAAIAGGTKFKLLEAMASGLPVVTTRAGISGLNARHNAEVLVADSPAEYLKAVKKLKADGKLRMRISKAARKLVEKSYSWDAIAQIQDLVWQQTI